MSSIKIIPREQIDMQTEYMERVRRLFDGKEKYICIQTYGCQQNEADSERLGGMAEQMGYLFTDQPSEADVILINTCAVREHAELKTLSITGQFKHLKENKPSLIIGICGCMVSQEHRIDDIKNKYPYVDFLFGTESLFRFPLILYNTLITEKRQFYVNEDSGNIAEGLPVRRLSGFRAWVSIMYGCNNYCTYCVVPYVRGRERSRARLDILNEVRSLAADGYREITLLGQNVNSYSSDIDSGYTFADLLLDVCAIEGNFKVRFMTSNPKDVSHRLIDVIAGQPKITKQFHLPLQSGNDRILSVMNRRYTSGSYLDTVRYMWQCMPDIALSTDIIVGFPTETEEEFEDTLKILEKIRFDSIYSFIYSKRKGTRAAEMEGQIPEDVKGQRFERLIAVQNRISYEKNQEYIGKIIDILVEGRSKTDDTRLTGRNEKGRLVHFSGGDELIGKIIPVKIERAETYALYGNI
jgi:tRNA-2-methylthio-N6-dimethylallyladenosine synthase